MKATPETHKLTVFEDVVGYIDYLAGCGTTSSSVTYTPPGKLLNVKVEFKVTKATKCFIVCSDAEPYTYDAKVFGTVVGADGVERATVFLEAKGFNDPEIGKVYEGTTDGLPHLIQVEFCKTGIGDPGAYWLTFTLILTYTYLLQGTLDVRTFTDSIEVSGWAVVVNVTSGYTPFYVKLDPGEYTVECTYNEETKTQAATVEEDKVTNAHFYFEAPPPPPKTWVRLRCEGVSSAQCVVFHGEYSDVVTVPTDFTVSPAGVWGFRALGETFQYWMVNGTRYDDREIQVNLEDGSDTTLTIHYTEEPKPPSLPDLAVALGLVAAFISIARLIYSGAKYFMD